MTTGSRQTCPRPEGLGRNLRSKTRWFAEFCNSHQVSHFATFFIDARAETLWKCATLSRRLVSAAICAFVLVVVDRAVEPVERVTCLNVAIASSSRHNRNAKHVPSLVLSLILCICHWTQPSSRLGKW